MVVLAKTKLNTIEVLISTALIYQYISYDEFVSLHNILREYNLKEAIKSLTTLTVHQRF